jgi:hypothetical protein
MSVTYPNINNLAYSFASVQFKIEGEIFTEITEINYNDGSDPGKLRGTGVKVAGRTAGQYEAEASFSMSLNNANRLLKKLGKGFYHKQFDITVSFQEEGADIIVDVLKNCRLKKNDASNSEGSDPTMRKFDLDVIEILWDGVSGIPDGR